LIFPCDAAGNDVSYATELRIKALLERNLGMTSTVSLTGKSDRSVEEGEMDLKVTKRKK
jgi:hypothetical protein